MPRPRRQKERRVFLADFGCMNKRRFKTEALAIDAAEFRMLENMSVELEVYQCYNCQFWHLTRQKRDRN